MQMLSVTLCTDTQLLRSYCTALLFQCEDHRASAPAVRQLQCALPVSEVSLHSTVVAERRKEVGGELSKNYS